MQLRNIICAASVVLGWILEIAALSTYLLFSRVDSEPGAKSPTEMLITAICLGGLGIVLFCGGNLVLFLTRAKKAAIVAWILVALIAVLACLMSPLLLVFLV
jgi:hypothetical protein